ncbi:hypothetical protein GCM10017691_45090 [Pseudonocardia petroleophila]
MTRTRTANTPYADGELAGWERQTRGAGGSPPGEFAAPRREFAAPRHEFAAPRREFAAPRHEFAAPRGEFAVDARLLGVRGTGA